jgi:hypothetical protein
MDTHAPIGASATAEASLTAKQARFARWQRVGGRMMVAGGLLLIAKGVVVIAVHGFHLPLALLVPVLMGSGLLTLYAGATGLALPWVRRRPLWVVVPAVPLSVLAFMLMLGGIDSLVLSALSSSAHPFLQMEAGLLAGAVVSIGLGAALSRTAPWSPNALD